MFNVCDLFFIIFIILSIFLFNGVNGEDGTEFDFETLTLNNLKLLGDAHLNNGSVRLTRDLPVPNSGSGRVLYSKPVRFRRPGNQFPASFSTFFTFSVTNLNPSSVGGGLAFLISPDDEKVGDAGGFLGLKSSSSSVSFVGVEFDTLMDVEFNDINGNHVGLDLNSLVSSEIGDLGGVEIELKSGDLINAWIDFDGLTKVFEVAVSYSNLKPNQPLLSFHLDLEKFVDDFMFVGFSGSTQGSTEIHCVEWWRFSSSFKGVSLSTPPAQPSQPSQPSQSSPPPTNLNFFNPKMGNSSTNSPPPPPASPIPSPIPSGSVSTKTEHNNNKSFFHRKPGAVAGIATSGAFVLAIFACFMFWVFSKRLKRMKKSESLTSEIIRTPKEFSYKELKLATKSFNPARVIGTGAFGTVYKGILPETGGLIAVKRCSHTGGQGKIEFLSELSIIGTLRHRNLVRLQGWCQERGEILLVYDYMPNGSLDKALFESRIVLPWPHRQKILMGVASALAYLHQECENQVIHRDVKASNIMLDADFNARLGDFGLARQIEHDKSPDATAAAGTMGYLAPEYLLTGRATEKTDVFSFGAVVLEVASGRRPIEKEGSSNLVEWVWSLHREGRLLGAADERLEGEFDEDEMERVLSVGLICSHPDQNVRPTMRSVVQMLVGEAEVPIVPRTKPTMSYSTSHLLLNLQDSVSDCNELITMSPSFSSDISLIDHHHFNGDELV